MKIDAIGGRDLMIIQGALCSQARYHRRLAEKNSDAEAKIRNLRNLAEVQSLMKRLDRAARAESPTEGA